MEKKLRIRTSAISFDSLSKQEKEWIALAIFNEMLEVQKSQNLENLRRIAQVFQPYSKYCGDLLGLINDESIKASRVKKLATDEKILRSLIEKEFYRLHSETEEDEENLSPEEYEHALNKLDHLREDLDARLERGNFTLQEYLDELKIFTGPLV